MLREVSELLPSGLPRGREIPPSEGAGETGARTRYNSDIVERPGWPNRHPADIEICLRYHGLTAPERDLLALVKSGFGGADVARCLGVPAVGSEFLRMRVFQKMGAETLIDLLIMADICASN